MSAFRAGCVENFFRGPNMSGPVPNTFRRMPGTGVGWSGLAPNVFRRMPGPGVNWQGPGPAQSPNPNPALLRRPPEMMGWAGGDMSGGRAREENRRTRSIPPLLGPGGRGEMAFPRRPNEGAPMPAASDCWNSPWQGDGGWWGESRAGMGGFPEASGGMSQPRPQQQPLLQQPQQQPLLQQPLLQQPQQQPLLQQPQQQPLLQQPQQQPLLQQPQQQPLLQQPLLQQPLLQQPQQQPLLPQPQQQPLLPQPQQQPLLPQPQQQPLLPQPQQQPLLPQPQQQPLLPQPQQQPLLQQPQQQPLLLRSSDRGLVHLGDRFVASEPELQHLFSLIQREAEKRGAPWVAGLSRAVEEISAAAEQESVWQVAQPPRGEHQERPTTNPSAVPVPGLEPSEGAPLQIRRVWIAGHSAITSASRRACSSSYGQHLGLAANGVQVLWMDKQGVRSDELIPALLRQAEVQTWPDALVIHLGSNDFEQITGIRLIKCIKKDLVFLTNTYPNTKMIWSDILPNRRRRHEKCLDRSRKKVNKQISDFVKSLGGIQVRHEFFSAECASLYKDDGVQLSDIGNDLFNMMLQGAIKSAFGIV